MEPFRSVCESSSLMMIFASLGDIHATRYRKTGRLADLKEAISATRIAVSTSAADDPLAPTLLNNLGSLLLRRHHDLGKQGDLDLAQYYTRQALNFISVGDKRFPRVLATIGTVRATRYDRQDDFADLEVAICKIQESLECRSMDETLHISLFNNLGALLWRQYRLTGRPQELDESILYLSKALEGPSGNTTERVTCLINCSFAFVQRYRLVEQLGDLDSALRHAQELMQLDPENDRLGILLGGLDTFLERRGDHTLQSAAKDPWIRVPAVLGFAALLAYFLLTALFYWIGISPSILLTLATFLSGAVGKWVIDQCVYPGGGNLSLSQSPFASALKTGKSRITRKSKADDYAPKILPAPLIAVPFSSSRRGSRKLDDHREQPLEQSLEQHPARTHQNPLTEHWRSLNVTGIDQYFSDSWGIYSKKHQSLQKPHRSCLLTQKGIGDRRYLHPKRHSTSRHQKCRRKSRTDMKFAGAHVETCQEALETARRESCLSTKKADLFVQRVVPPLKPSDFSTSAQDANTAYESGNEEDQPQLPSQVQVPESPQRDIKNPVSVDRLQSQDEPSLSPETETQPLQECEYLEHRIWHDVPSSGAKTANIRQTSIIYQGDTTHELATNEGLDIGNVSGKRTEIVGHVSYEGTQSAHQSLLGGDRAQPAEPNQGASRTISKAPEGISCTSINFSPFQNPVSEKSVDSPPGDSVPTMKCINSDDDEKESQKGRKVRPTIYQDSSSEASIKDNGKREYDDYTEEDERRNSKEWDVQNRARELNRYSLGAEEEEAEHEAKQSLVDDSVRAYIESLGLEM